MIPWDQQIEAAERGACLALGPITSRMSGVQRKAAFRALCARDGAACRECGHDTDLHVDHVLALGLGGTNARDNLQLLCAPCHRYKTGKEQSAIKRASRWRRT